MPESPFLPLLLITALAVAVPMVINRIPRFPLPIVVGEILAGIVIGQSGFNLVTASETLDFLAEFGFAFLMFLSGLEIDFDLLSLRNLRRQEGPILLRTLPMAGMIFVGTLTLGFLGGLSLFRFGVVQNPLLMGLILSTTSLGVVVPVLKEEGLIESKYGQAMLVNASIADFATLLLLTIVIAINSRGLTLELLLIPVLLLVFLFAAQAARRVARLGFLQRFVRELSHATSQIRVRMSFALMVAWVVLAEALGVELILGAFLAGAIVALITDSESSPARVKLDAIGYGFFIPIFFIMVGVGFDLQSLITSSSALLLVGALIVSAFVVKALPSVLLRSVYSTRNTIAAGVLLSSRLSLIIAAAAIALDIGAISEMVNSAVILLAIVSCTSAPIVFRRIYERPEDEEPYGIILVGADQLTEFLARRLATFDEPVRVLCTEASKVNAFRRLGVEVCSGSPTDAAVLRSLGAGSARALVDLTRSVEDTMNLCELATQEFGIGLVISRISDVELVPPLQAIGVRVVQPALATVMALEGALRYQTVFDVLVHRAEEVEVEEVILRNGKLTGMPVRDLRLPGNALIVSIKRDDTVMVPHGDTVLRLGDRLDLIGSPGSLERSSRFLGA